MSQYIYIVQRILRSGGKLDKRFMVSCTSGLIVIKESKFNQRRGLYSTRHFCHDLELHRGDRISSPVDSIVSLVARWAIVGPGCIPP